MNKLLSDRRLLVVEDEALVLMMIEDMLADLGCSSVTNAGSVDSAISLIDGQRFDFAMLDMNLNGDSSCPVAEVLAARDVPFIYCTGNTSLDMKDGYPDRPVLKKPFKFEQLAAILARQLCC
jgi:CheY-like chemotaxis protein